MRLAGVVAERGEMEKPQAEVGVGGPKERADKPLVKDLNDHIVCPLCRGYLIDATTLVECLHSFCRGCILRRLHNGPKTCPVCSASALNPPIADVGLQRLVYLVVPGLFRSEQERRRHFRQVNPQCAGGLTQLPLGAPDLSFDDLVSLSLCELDSTSEGSTRYLKCPAGVTVRHLLRLLMLKRGWDDTEGKGQQCGNNKIEMMYEASGLKSDMEVLDPSWTLMDLACIFEWKREAPMKLLYRITKIDEPTSDSFDTSSGSTTTTTDTSSQAIENIQRPPTPPPSPKPAISRTDPLDKTPRPTPPTTTTTVVDQYSSSEPKKPRCEVTPVMRAPDPPPSLQDRQKSAKLPKLEHQHKRKKRRNKRVIAEITTTPREDLLKLKVRLTPCPPRVTSNTGSGSQSKDQLLHVRAVRKDKTKPKNRAPKPGPIIEEVKSITDKEFTETAEPIAVPATPAKPTEPEKPVAPIATVENDKVEKEEPPKNEEVLRRLGLVAISEANKTRQEKAKSPARSATDKADPAVEREKLEKQLRESKANRVRSLLAEKQMRDTLKSIMSNNKEVTSAATTTSSSTPRSDTPTTTSGKRKEPPPLTPLRNVKRQNVTFAPCSFPSGKYESPLDLSSPSNVSKDNALDLSSSVPELTVSKLGPGDKPVSILRNSASRLAAEKPKEEPRKSQDTNLRTLSDAAVSLLGGNPHVDKAAKLPQNFMGSPAGGTSGMANKVALRIPQPHQRITGFGMKIKPNIGVRHIPNPQAVVASQYRNQRGNFFNLAHQPP
ncbi:polycomb group protein Psc isoform X1 [Nasonia vitripennis]|uniref:RING-type domain-containing protein n=2 Tax=Nasonia vitripennis TaxID=7425 RepID=A0A7M7IPZ6_NASVI|nr:polycomb group protein Psc isoform X1 [Nasonia vitripennis]